MIIRLSAFADEAAGQLGEQIAALKENNIPLLEIRNVNGKNISALTLDEARGYSEQLKGEGIAVWSLGSPIGKVRAGVNIKKYSEKMEHTCRLAEVFNAENIRAFSFYALSNKRARRTVIEKLNVLSSIAASHSLSLCHENEKHIYGDTVDRINDLLANVPGMKLVYDPANFLQSGETAEKTLTLVEKAHYFHVKDVLGRSRVVPAGFGDGRLADIVNRLKRDAVFSIEPHLMLFKGCEGFNKSELARCCDLSTKRGRFDCAVASFKKLLTDNGFTDCGAYFEKK